MLSRAIMRNPRFRPIRAARRAAVLAIPCLIAIAVLPVTPFAGAAWAQGDKRATAAEAKAMLTRAVAAMKKDRKKALADFIAGRNGFKDRDLYVFCARKADGVIVASGMSKRLLGVNMKKLVTKKGRFVGMEILAAAKPGRFSTMRIQSWRPGSKGKQVPKVLFVTEAAGHACTVGYYPETGN